MPSNSGKSTSKKTPSEEKRQKKGKRKSSSESVDCSVCAPVKERKMALRNSVGGHRGFVNETVSELTPSPHDFGLAADYLIDINAKRELDFEVHKEFIIKVMSDAAFREFFLRIGWKEGCLWVIARELNKDSIYKDDLSRATEISQPPPSPNQEG